MSSSLGPWATAIESDGGEQLSALWKNRMHALQNVNACDGVTRRQVLAAGAAALAVWSLPTLSGLASAPEHTEDRTADRPANVGRIYVSVGLVADPPGAERQRPRQALVAIDPETGDWTTLIEGDVEAARISPDGQTVAYALEDEGLFTADARAAENPGRVYAEAGPPAWSPDGREIMATTLNGRGEDGQPRFETVKIRAAGGGAAVPVPVPDTDILADWSSDGKWLLTESDRRRPNVPRYSMFVMKPDGRGERRITPDGVHGYKARFSPDGRRIALYGGDKDSRFVRIADLDGTNERTILREGATETPNGMCWSPDGRRLAVVMFDYKLTGDGKTLGTNFDEHDFRIELIYADGTNRRRLKLQDKPGQRINYFSGHPDWR